MVEREQSGQACISEKHIVKVLLICVMGEYEGLDFSNLYS